jgi:phage shock protein PspC (stress-responsive transcriptional regulator)
MNGNTEDLRSESQPHADHEPGARPRQPLRRPTRGRMVAGVAAAIARHFDVDVAIVRVVFVILTIVGFVGVPFLGSVPLFLGGIPLYLACWLLIPEEGCDSSIAGSVLRSSRR